MHGLTRSSSAPSAERVGGVGECASAAPRSAAAWRTAKKRVFFGGAAAAASGRGGPPPPRAVRAAQALDVDGASAAPFFALRPLRWPESREEQLQLLCSVKRMLRQLQAHLQATSSTVLEALPRRSVSLEGLVSCGVLHEWLCQLARDPPADHGLSAAAANNANSSGTHTPTSGAFSHVAQPGLDDDDDDDDGACARPSAVEGERELISAAASRGLSTFLDARGTGRVRLVDLTEAFRVAKRLGLDRDEMPKPPAGAAHQDDDEHEPLERDETRDDRPPCAEFDKELMWFDDEKDEGQTTGHTSASRRASHLNASQTSSFTDAGAVRVPNVSGEVLSQTVSMCGNGACQSGSHFQETLQSGRARLVAGREDDLLSLSLSLALERRARAADRASSVRETCSSRDRVSKYRRDDV